MQAKVSAHPLVKTALAGLRDKSTPPAAFRRLVDVASTIVLCEALSELDVESHDVETPLVTTSVQHLAHDVCFVPILRAGLGMVEAALRLVPEASVRHVGLRRNESTLEPETYYDGVDGGAGLAGLTTVLLDPMLATGGSACSAIELLKAAGADQIRFVALLGAPEGVETLGRNHPDVQVSLAAIDERLTTDADPWPAGYILPGLGDAGDRVFGT